MTDQEKFELDLIYQKLLQTIIFRYGKRNRYGNIAGKRGETLSERVERIAIKDRHSYNVAYYCYAIGNEMGLPPSKNMSLFIGGMLHDVGKIVIPDSILFKPGRLTSEEYEVVKKHPLAGYRLIREDLNIEDEIVLSVVLYHHERIDGNGYPKKLVGEEIPLVARIASVADAFDAMTSERVYRSRRTVQEAVVELRRGRGTQFDGEIVNLFIEMIYSGKIDLEKLWRHDRKTLRCSS